MCWFVHDKCSVTHASLTCHLTEWNCVFCVDVSWSYCWWTDTGTIYDGMATSQGQKKQSWCCPDSESFISTNSTIDSWLTLDPAHVMCCETNPYMICWLTGLMWCVFRLKWMVQQRQCHRPTWESGSRSDGNEAIVMSASQLLLPATQHKFLSLHNMQQDVSSSSMASMHSRWVIVGESAATWR